MAGGSFYGGFALFQVPHFLFDDEIAMVEVLPLQAQDAPQVFPMGGAVAMLHTVIAGAGFAFRRFGAGGFFPWLPAANGFALFLFFGFGPGSHGIY